MCPVTILILIDGFLQYVMPIISQERLLSHNPYFNRWFSAMTPNTEFMNLLICHNPYFNRWFSAIKKLMN